MSKYTREQVIKEKRCGIKYVEQVSGNVESRKKLIKLTIKIAKQFPDVWYGNKGWSNVSWALGNAVIETLNTNKSIMQTWNLDEVLSDEEMKFIASELNLKTEEYAPSWSRKTSLIDLLLIQQEWLNSDNQETLAQMLKKHGWTRKEFIEKTSQ